MPITRSSVIHSLLWKFLERCSIQVVSFIVTIVLARLLTPSDYGLIALVSVFVNLASVIVEGGLNSALIQKKDADSIDFSTIFYTSIGVALVLYSILFFCAYPISKFYNDIYLVDVLRVLGLSLFLYAINSVQKAFLVRNMLFKKLFYSSLGGVLLSGILGVILAYNGFGVWALVAQSIVAQLAITVIMWYTVKWRPIRVFSWKRFISLFDFGWKIFASNMLVNLFINLRSLVIGKVYNPGALAYFDKGKQFPALLIENINTSIQSVLFPVMSSVQDSTSSVRAITRRAIKLSAFIIFPLVFGLAIIAKPMVICLLTEKWLEAVPFIQIFCISYLLLPMQIANMEAIKALGHSGTTLKLECAKKCIELAILIITIPMGVQAIAWGIVGYNLIALIVNTYPNRRYLDYSVAEQIKDIFPQFLISCLMGAILYLINLLDLSTLQMLIIDIIIGAIIYILLNMLFNTEILNYLRSVSLRKYKQNGFEDE